MLKEPAVNIGTAKLLLDSEYRLLQIGDNSLFVGDDLTYGADLRQQWLGFDGWLEQYDPELPDGSSFHECIPGTMASLTHFGSDLTLLHIWHQLDALTSTLSRVQYNALVFASDRSLVFANQAAERLFQELQLETWAEALPADFDTRFDGWLADDRPTKQEVECNDRLYRWEISPGPNNQYLVMVCHPLADRENYRRILEYSVDGIYQASRAGELVFANHSLARLFGYDSPADMKRQVGRRIHSIYRFPEDHRRFTTQVRDETEVIGFECEMYRKDGESIWVRQNARSVNDDHGQLTQIIGTVADVTEFKQSELARKRAEKDYRRLFKTAQAGLYQSTGEGQGRFLDVNDMFARILGFENPEQCLNHYADLGRQLWVNDRKRRQLLESLKREHQVSNQRIAVKHRNGSHIWVLLNARYIKDPDTGKEIVEGSIFDITDQVRAENEIRFLAEHDPLTQLPNRSRFQQVLMELYRHWQGHGFHDFIVIFIDLDHFKDINDTLGHLVGDVLLTEVAERLQQPLNCQYETFRLGGDEFAIVVDGDLTETELDVFCDQVCRRISREHIHQENHLKVTASLGVVYGSQLALSESQSPIEDIMRAADLALYSCKRSGRASYHRYHESMRQQLKSEKELEQRLATAIHNDELELYFQPLFECRSEVICGVEALLRWPTDDGMISPGVFIPLAERCGLIADIDAWVLRQILAQCELLADRYPQLVLSFNLSAHHFNFDSFADLIAPLQSKIKRWGPNIALELTERVMFNNTSKVIQSLNELRHLGVTVSLDDFGTGYSSLSYLTQFPVDKIKIDQSFIRDMLTNTTAMAVVQAAAQIGKTLKLAVNAEGVETEAEYEYIRSLDIDEVQGFYLGYPMPLAELLTTLERSAKPLSQG